MAPMPFSVTGMMLLIDVGGTMTRVALASKEGDLSSPTHFPTESDFTAGIQNIADAYTAYGSSQTLEGIVMGITGQVSSQGELIQSPNLRGWEDRDIRNVLFERFNAPSYVLNDAQLCGLGEAVKGAGQGARTVLYMTLGTGIGFSRIIEGMPDLTIGSETGHQYIDIDGDHLVEAEDIVSGRALKARFGVGGEAMHDRMLWEEYARLAAIPLYNALLAFMPDRVVVGGSLVKEGSLSVTSLSAHLARIATHLTHIPEIVHATLGDDAGLYGAQAYGARMLS